MTATELDRAIGGLWRQGGNSKHPRYWHPDHGWLDLQDAVRCGLVRNLAAYHGLSQWAFAAALGISVATVGRWCRGDTAPIGLHAERLERWIGRHLPRGNAKIE